MTLLSFCCSYIYSSFSHYSYTPVLRFFNKVHVFKSFMTFLLLKKYSYPTMIHLVQWYFKEPHRSISCLLIFVLANFYKSLAHNHQSQNDVPCEVFNKVYIRYISIFKFKSFVTGKITRLHIWMRMHPMIKENFFKFFARIIMSKVYR